MSKTATQRDVTRIVNLAVEGAIAAYPKSEEGRIFGQIFRIAKAIAARSGRRDPSVRKAAKRA